MNRNRKPAKLTLSKETVRTLGDRELAAVGGGYGWTLTLGQCCPPPVIPYWTAYAGCLTYRCTDACSFGF